MNYTFKKGDKVSVLNDTIVGKIIEIKKLVAKIEDTNGFEYEYQLYDLVLHSESIYNEVEVYAKDKAYTKKSKPLTSIDLHIGKLTPFPKSISPAERLLVQKEALLEGIEKAKRSGIKKIEIIHGVGDGIVQNMVHDTLMYQLNLEFHNREILHHQSGGVIVYLQ